MFLKKFDRQRKPKPQQQSMQEEELPGDMPVLTKKRSSQYDRMSKKLESAREYVRQNSEYEGAPEEDEESFKQQLRLSRLSQSRQTLKKMQMDLLQADSPVFEEAKDEPGYQEGRSSIFDKIMDPTDEEDPLFNVPGRQSGNDKPASVEDESMIDDEELESSEGGTDEDEEQDLYFAIKEEDDEEDSFEKEKRSKRERQMKEFERKMDLVDSQALVIEKPQRDARTFVVAGKSKLESFDEVLSRES